MLVSHRYPPDGVAGVERYTQMVAGRLAEVGDEVTVVSRRITRATGVAPVRERIADRILALRLEGEEITPARFLRNSSLIETAFATLLAEFEPDVVHVNHLKDLSPGIIDVAHAYGAAVVLSLHDFFLACPRAHLEMPDGRLCDGPDGGKRCAESCFAHEQGHALDRWRARADYYWHVLDAVDSVICPSTYVSRYFIEHGLQASKVEVIPNGVLSPRTLDFSRSPNNGVSDGRLNLAFLGSVVPHKGVDLILRALRLANIGAVNLLVLGKVYEFAYASELRMLAEAVPDLSMRFGGRYELDWMDDLLCNVDCVVVPSRVPETFSLTAREALVRGIPVLASRIGALGEAVLDGENGFTFPPGDISTLAALIQRIAEDKALLYSLKSGARRTDVPSVSEHVNRLRHTYEGALQVARGRKSESLSFRQGGIDVLRTLVSLGFA